MAGGEHGQADLHTARNEIEARKNTHATKAGKGLLQVSVNAIQRQRNSPDSKIRGNGGNVLHGESAGVIQGDQRHAEHGQIHGERNHEEQDLVGARHDDALHDFHIHFRLHI